MQRPDHDEQEPSSSNQLLRTIFSSISALASERDLNRQLVILADMGRDMVGAERCVVWVLNPKTDELWSKVASGLDRITIPRSQGMAGYVATHGEPLIINDPYEDPRFDKEVDKNILALPLQDTDGRIVGVYQACNKMTGSGEFTQTDLDHLRLAARFASEVLQAAILTEEIEAGQREIIYTMSEAGERRSQESYSHANRVAEYSRLLGTKYGLKEKETDLLKWAAFMHDIGKIAIPDAILLKPGKLNEEEWAIMKTHTTLGHNFLKFSERPLLKSAATVAYEHHERWDGTGYPRGLKKEQIHLFGRICGLAEVFAALGSKMTYKEAWEFDRIVDLIKTERGRQFDPHAVEVFLTNIEDFKKLHEIYAKVTKQP